MLKNIATIASIAALGVGISACGQQDLGGYANPEEGCQALGGTAGPVIKEEDGREVNCEGTKSPIKNPQTGEVLPLQVESNYSTDDPDLNGGYLNTWFAEEVAEGDDTQGYDGSIQEDDPYTEE